MSATTPLFPETDTPEPAWTGWYRRPRGQWRAVVVGDHEPTVFHALLDFAERDGSRCCEALVSATMNGPPRTRTAR